MSLNWVMLSEQTAASPSKQDFIPLPNERTVFKSSHRTSLSLTTPKSTYPAHAPNISITSSDGTVYLTNQRVIYLPRSNSNIASNVAGNLKSFSCPLLNLHDTHLVMPWFGPNAWTALVQAVAGGGLPTSTAGIELKFTFKEGGAPDFQGKFEAIKERLQQVVEQAREVNTSRNVDMTNVHLDQLPSYQDSGHDRRASDDRQETSIENDEPPIPLNATADQVRAMAAAAAQQRQQEQIRRGSREEVEAQETPSDAPPGYEEAQHQIVQTELDSRINEEMETWREPGTRAAV